MNLVSKAGLASFAVAAAALSIEPVSAADLGGSVKDTYVPPMRLMHRPSVGPCYFRVDVGASISGDPNSSWPVYNETFVDAGDANAVIDANEINFTFAGSDINNISIENTWLAEFGGGCGSGSRGMRVDVAFGFRGERDLDGDPAVYQGSLLGQPEGTATTPVDDPLHTTIRSYTLMLNANYDLGRWFGVVPYIGAGVGVAHHTVDEVFFTGNPNLVNKIEGDSDIAFAWSVMAGFGYQLSERAIIDVGYRYINMGKATSERVDSANFVNPRVIFDDIDAHEVKVGLRYHFGGGPY